jgi:hypothetical protein
MGCVSVERCGNQSEQSLLLEHFRRTVKNTRVSSILTTVCFGPIVNGRGQNSAMLTSLPSDNVPSYTRWSYYRYEEVALFRSFHLDFVSCPYGHLCARNGNACAQSRRAAYVLRFCRGVTPNMAATSHTACFADISAPPPHGAHVCKRVGGLRSAEKSIDVNRLIMPCCETQ